MNKFAFNILSHLQIHMQSIFKDTKSYLGEARFVRCWHKSCMHKTNIPSLYGARCKNGLGVRKVKKVKTVLTNN